MSEALDFVKPVRRGAEPAEEVERMLAMSEALDFVKPVRRDAVAEHMSAMSESLDYVRQAA